MPLVLGIDEAGRGPVLGPMVVAGVLLEKEDENCLKKEGVTDSKLLSPNRREQLAVKIKSKAKKIETVELSAKQLDELMDIMSLNDIELNAMVRIINAISAENEGIDAIYIDLPSNGPGFMLELRAKIADNSAKIVAEHKADSAYTVVGAASIIAKTQRDKKIEEIQKKYCEYADLGSGYPADERTIAFLKSYIKKHGKLPDEARGQWATAKELMKKEKQKTLF